MLARGGDYLNENSTHIVLNQIVSHISNLFINIYIQQYQGTPLCKLLFLMYPNYNHYILK